MSKPGERGARLLLKSGNNVPSLWLASGWVVKTVGIVCNYVDSLVSRVDFDAPDEVCFQYIEEAFEQSIFICVSLA